MKEFERPNEDEEFEDASVIGYEDFQLKRLNAQEPPVNQEKCRTFSCKECDSTLKSKGLLDAHIWRVIIRSCLKIVVIFVEQFFGRKFN